MSVLLAWDSTSSPAVLARVDNMRCLGGDCDNHWRTRSRIYSACQRACGDRGDSHKDRWGSGGWNSNNGGLGSSSGRSTIGSNDLGNGRTRNLITGGYWPVYIDEDSTHNNQV